MPQSDSELIEKIRRGATHHYALLIDRYKEKAMTLAVRMLRNREDAEEAIQDAFIRAYRGLEKFEGTAKFSTWFYRIVYNVCLTRLGKRREEFLPYDENVTAGNDATIAAAAVGGEELPLDAEVERRDLVSLVGRVMETLPPKYRTILSLFYLQELSHEEICGITDLPLGTVKVHLFRARALLQEAVRRELAHDLSMESILR